MCVPRLWRCQEAPNFDQVKRITYRTDTCVSRWENDRIFQKSQAWLHWGFPNISMKYHISMIWRFPTMKVSWNHPILNKAKFSSGMAIILRYPHGHGKPQMVTWHSYGKWQNGHLYSSMVDLPRIPNRNKILPIYYLAAKTLHQAFTSGFSPDPRAWDTMSLRGTLAACEDSALSLEVSIKGENPIEMDDND